MLRNMKVRLAEDYLFVIKYLFKQFDTSQIRLLLRHKLNLFLVNIDILIFMNTDHMYTALRKYHLASLESLFV